MYREAFPGVQGLTPWSVGTHSLVNRDSLPREALPGPLARGCNKYPFIYLSGTVRRGKKTAADGKGKKILLDSIKKIPPRRACSTWSEATRWGTF